MGLYHKVGIQGQVTWLHHVAVSYDQHRGPHIGLHHKFVPWGCTIQLTCKAKSNTLELYHVVNILGHTISIT